MTKNTQQDSNTHHELVTKRHIAAVTNVSTRCIDNWMSDGLIPYRKIGKLVRFDVAEVREALNRFTVPTKD